MSPSEDRRAGGTAVLEDGAAAPLLDVRRLTVTHEPGPGASTVIVDGIDLLLAPGERLALVGESGSGKSLTALGVLGLVDPPLRASSSRHSLLGRELSGLSPRQWREVRGRQIALVQQDPLTALSPVFDVGTQVAEAVRRHRGLSRREALVRARELLDQVGVPDPGARARDYPHQLSGGLRQRVAIAAALAAEPALLLADEPTTALDVTVQAQVMELLHATSESRGTGVLLITHDLGLLPGFAHTVAVMYSGRIVERGPARVVLQRPRHPYTALLLAAQPGRPAHLPPRRLPVIAGSPPSPERRPPGCPFAPRCPLAVDVCRTDAPPLIAVGPQWAACHRSEDAAGLRAEAER